MLADDSCRDNLGCHNLAKRVADGQKSSMAAPWLNWIEQPPPKGQVAGSNPAGITICFVLLPDAPEVCANALVRSAQADMRIG